MHAGRGEASRVGHIVGHWVEVGSHNQEDHERRQSSEFVYFVLPEGLSNEPGAVLDNSAPSGPLHQRRHVLGSTAPAPLLEILQKMTCVVRCGWWQQKLRELAS